MTSQVIFETKLLYFQAHSCLVIPKLLHCVCVSEPLIKWQKTHDSAELVFFVYYTVSLENKAQEFLITSQQQIFSTCRHESHKIFISGGEKESGFCKKKKKL